MSDSDAAVDAARDQMAASLSDFLGASYAPGKLSEGADKEAFHDRFNHRMVHMGLRRQHNLEAIFNAAFEAADTLGQSAVDGDWLARFMLCAEQVGVAAMQQVWGLILAHEYEKPGSVSYSSLACLSDMTPADLALWEQVGRLVSPEGYLFKVGGRNRFERFGVSGEQIVHLQTIGLLQEAQDLSVTYSADSRGLTFAFRGGQVILRHPELVLFTLPTFKLSSAGVELFELLTDQPVNEDYLRAFGSELKPLGYDYRIRRADGELVE